MPYLRRQNNRKNTRKPTMNRRTTRRNVRKPKATLVAKPQVYPFRRSTEAFLDMSSPSDGWLTTLDNQLVKTFTYNLNQLPNHSEFVNLFSQYKLNYAMVEMFPNVSQMVSGYTQTGGSSSNYLVTVWRNTHGVPLTAAFTRDELLEIQNKRTFMLPTTKPTRFKMPLKQLATTYASTLNSDYATIRPRYINTSEDTTQHYGINVAITRVDGSAFAADAANTLVRSTVLFTCKQVK
ncbi:MAG: capsid protein [Cressdnaviricota sp.]|nr:MAG: capsid protein [Cressdnaviricota sp.]